MHEEFPTFLTKSFGTHLEPARDFIINSPQHFSNQSGIARRLQTTSERFVRKSWEIPRRKKNLRAKNINFTNFLLRVS